MTTKYCSACEQTLIVGVNWTEAQKGKSTYKCNSCRAEYQRKYHEDNKEVRNEAQKIRYYNNREAMLANQREYWVNKKYGLTIEEYEDILQNDCAICGATEDMVLDHCHTTGDVRGCLCRTCNAGLGLFKDNAETVKKAEAYLRGN